MKGQTVKSLCTIHFINGDSYQIRGTLYGDENGLTVYGNNKKIVVPFRNVLYWIEETDEQA